MKRLLLLTLTFFMMSHYGQAQTSPANAGLHEAESAPEFAFTGTGWVQVVDGDYVVMESSDLGDEVSFEFNGASIILFRELLLVEDSPAVVEVCLDAICTPLSNEATELQVRVPIAFFADGASPHHLTISNTDGGIFRLDYLIVMPENDLEAIAAPAPSTVFMSLESGQVVAVDFSITGGEIAQIIFLALLSGLVAYLIVILRTASHE